MRRTTVVAQIQRIVAPHLYDSGFRKALNPSKGIFGGTRPLRLWAPKEPIEIDGFALTEVLAITEDGIMEDAYSGAAVTGTWDCYPLEDLATLLTALEALPIFARSALNQGADDGR